MTSVAPSLAYAALGVQEEACIILYYVILCYIISFVLYYIIIHHSILDYIISYTIFVFIYIYYVYYIILYELAKQTAPWPVEVFPKVALRASLGEALHKNLQVGRKAILMLRHVVGPEGHLHLHENKCHKALSKPSTTSSM